MTEDYHFDELLTKRLIRKCKKRENALWMDIDYHKIFYKGFDIEYEEVSICYISNKEYYQYSISLIFQDHLVVDPTEDEDEYYFFWNLAFSREVQSLVKDLKDEKWMMKYEKKKTGRKAVIGW